MIDIIVFVEFRIKSKRIVSRHLLRESKHELTDSYLKSALELKLRDYVIAR